ncbi:MULTISPECIES: helix-turn-helix transcriptional regulator [unclassified Streptomyces]|uniref:helix-turn-helix domain-containing protein n=1 Tax=unclassified Streptomyces TaxID=2593676 RepID=UPI00278848F4|nr:helix-turn-helix transcriptional regulator [Streptomyces sp. DSM 40167]MDQ0405616.1 transcriptional regulator with XRE-family HTH domain [Streptomyces sp. DSM 40167]
MAPRNRPTARQVRLGTELRRLREAAGLKAREVAGLLSSTSAQMSQVEAGFAGASEERVRRLAAHYACADDALVEALVALATGRSNGWWDEFRGVLPPVFLDVAELEHHATFLHEVVITHVPGLLQTPDYARAVFGYMVPELPDSELTPRVEHRMRRRAVIDRNPPVPYETIVHEAALRIRVGDRAVSRAQLRRVLDESEKEHITVRVVPFDTDHFAGASAAMMHVGGPLPILDTVLRDSPSGTAFLDAHSQLERFRTLFRKVGEAALDPIRTRDFIHKLAREL